MMAVKSLVNIPVLDLESEKRRWNNIYKVLSEPKPDIESPPRKAVWKKGKAVLWYHAASEKKYTTPLFLVYSLLNKSVYS
jgi:hypothetical protein